MKGLVKCDLCGKEFEKEIRAINEARKGKYRIFCSKDCFRKARSKTEIRQCLTCGLDVEVKQNRICRSKTGKIFCSSSCAAKNNNLGRHRTEQEKAKISMALFGRRRNGEGNSWTTASCLICGKEFKYPFGRHRVTCSSPCGQIHQFGSLPYSKEEAVALLLKMKQETGDTPSSKLIERRVVHAIKRYFGTWNKAMQSLGLDPNTQWIRKKNLLCLDGHKAESISEMLVDNWLYENGIKHERMKLYPEGKMNCDFFLCDLNIWMEYFGLAGQHPYYDKKILMKREIAKRHGIRLIEILPCHLYPKIKIAEFLK
jgi:hypothetical protein